MLYSTGSSNPHLFHQLLHRQIRIARRDFGIVKRNKFEAVLSIQPAQNIDLRTTKIALAVVKNDVFLGLFAHRGLLVWETVPALS